MIPPKEVLKKLFGVTINKKQNILLNIGIVAFVIFLLSFMLKYSEKQRKIYTERWNKLEFSGIVDRLTIDYSNHAVTTIYLTNGIRQKGLPQLYYSTIKKDDSIFKVKNNDTIFFKRQNRLMKVQ
jgi:hypothetical protein